MPVVKPGESIEEYIPRCIEYVMKNGEAENDKQAFAICKAKYEAGSRQKINVKEWTAEKNFEEVFEMGLVDEPAIEENFITLSKQEVKLSLDEEKRIIVGAALIPNFPIYRAKKETYYKFNEDTIKTLAHKFLSRNYNNNITDQHIKRVDGVELLESWVVENESDKINSVYGKNYKPGTWCLMYHVSNDKIWNDIKTGKINGFSISAVLGETDMLSTDEDEIFNEEFLSLIESLINELKNKQK